MSLALSSVRDYVQDVRTLLLDKIKPYRYSDEDIVRGLNLALLEARRVRADLFVCRYGNDVPRYEGVTGEEVPIEAQFRLPFTYEIVSQVLRRDDEDVQDARANGFHQLFYSAMVGTTPFPPPVQGGTPPPGSAQR